MHQKKQNLRQEAQRLAQTLWQIPFFSPPEPSTQSSQYLQHFPFQKKRHSFVPAGPYFQAFKNRPLHRSYTIDSRDCQMPEDAFWCEPREGGGYKFELHVSDSYLIEEEIQHQALLHKQNKLTLPLKNVSIEMKKRFFALREKEIRPAIAFIINFGPAGNILELDIKFILSHVIQAFTSDKPMADVSIPAIQQAFELTKKLEHLHTPSFSPKTRNHNHVIKVSTILSTLIPILSASIGSHYSNFNLPFIYRNRSMTINDHGIQQTFYEKMEYRSQTIVSPFGVRKSHSIHYADFNWTQYSMGHPKGDIIHGLNHYARFTCPLISLTDKHNLNVLIHFLKTRHHLPFDHDDINKIIQQKNQNSLLNFHRKKDARNLDLNVLGTDFIHSIINNTPSVKLISSLFVKLQELSIDNTPPIILHDKTRKEFTLALQQLSIPNKIQSNTLSYKKLDRIVTLLYLKLLENKKQTIPSAFLTDAIFFNNRNTRKKQALCPKAIKIVRAQKQAYRVVRIAIEKGHFADELYFIKRTKDQKAIGYQPVLVRDGLELTIAQEQISFLKRNKRKCQLKRACETLMIAFVNNTLIPMPENSRKSKIKRKVKFA